MDAIWSDDKIMYISGRRLFPPNLWKCSECLHEIISEKCPTECPEGCKTKQFERITSKPPISGDQTYWYLPKYKELSHVNINEIYEEIHKMINDLYVFPMRIYYKLYALWCISTYKIQYWRIVPYVIFYGDTECGKTEAASFGADMSHKIAPPGSSTETAMIRYAHIFNAGLSIDEAHDVVRPGGKLFKYCKEGYRRGAKYTVSDINDQDDIKVYNSFGYKQFMTEHELPRQISNRGITIPMFKEIPKTPNREYIKKDFDIIKNKLFNWYLITGKPPIIPPDFPLTGRLRDIYEPIIRIAMMLNIDYDDIIEYANSEKKAFEEKVNSGIDATIAVQLFELIKGEKLDIVPFTILRKRVYPFDDGDEPDVKESKIQGGQIGLILKKAGITTRYAHGKTNIYVRESNNRQRLMMIWKRYGIVGHNNRSN